MKLFINDQNDLYVINTEHEVVVDTIPNAVKNIAIKFATMATDGESVISTSCCSKADAIDNGYETFLYPVSVMEVLKHAACDNTLVRLLNDGIIDQNLLDEYAIQIRKAA